MAIARTVGYAIAFGGGIAVPFAATALDDTEAVRRLQTLLPFEGWTVDPDTVGEEPSVDERSGDPP